MNHSFHATSQQYTLLKVYEIFSTHVEVWTWNVLPAFLWTIISQLADTKSMQHTTGLTQMLITWTPMTWCLLDQNTLSQNFHSALFILICRH